MAAPNLAHGPRVVQAGADFPPLAPTSSARREWIHARAAGTLCAMTKLPLTLVTGAGRGIGAEIALRLAREGAPVICAARSLEACTELADAIRADGGLAYPAYLDVADPEAVRGGLEDALLDARKELRGEALIGWLVNNAGIAETAPFLRHGRESGVDTFEKHMRVNFHGARRMIEAFAPAMIERKYGRIVNIASSAGLRGYPYAAAYVASKHALVGYSRCVAAELAKTGVTLNLVCPHYVESPMTEQTVARIVGKTGKSEAETRAFLASQNPGGTMVSPAEVAAVVAQMLRGDMNGRIAELIGGKGRVPDEKTVVWQDA
jgi:NAD(P)-dependent dehydrogenase (short-subunit alcohol dehydrogenase family)